MSKLENNIKNVLNKLELLKKTHKIFWNRNLKLQTQN